MDSDTGDLTDYLLGHEWNNSSSSTTRYTAKSFPLYPTCQHQGTTQKAFQCLNLTMEDITAFHSRFYANPNKTVQDRILWDHIFVRKTGEDSVRRMVSMTYTIPSYDGSCLITVCKETFLKVLRVSKVRIHNVLRKYFHNENGDSNNRSLDPSLTRNPNDSTEPVIEILDDSDEEIILNDHSTPRQSDNGAASDNGQSPSGPIKFRQCRHPPIYTKCKSNELTEEDMLQFRNKYYKLKMKQTKDSFLLKYIEVKPLKYLQVGQKCGPNDFRIIYKVPKMNGRLIRVCQRAFVDVLAVYWSRVCNMVQTLIRKGRFDRLRHSLDTSAFVMQNGLEIKDENQPKMGNLHAISMIEDGLENESYEMIPNNHLMINFDEAPEPETAENSVLNFVKSFADFESHFCHGQLEKQFLPKELSLDKLWELYKDSEVKKEDVNEVEFRKIIDSKMDLRFDSPTQNSCQKCVDLKMNSDNPNNLVSRKAIAELYAHECSVAAFQTLLHDSDPSIKVISIKHSNKISLPKFSTHPNFKNSSVDCFYVTIVEGVDAGIKENVSNYLWTEVDAQNSINELVSTVYYKLLMLHHSNVKTIRIVNDGCSSLYLKKVMITMCLKFLEEDPSPYLKTIELIYPVPGHFSLPPDQICDCIRYVTNQRNHILNPDAIKEILSQFGSVHMFQDDLPLLDFKVLCEEVLMHEASFHFNLAKCKRFVISKMMKKRTLVRGEQFYNHSFGHFESVLKEPIYGKIMVKLDIGIRMNPTKANQVEKAVLNSFGTGWHTFEDLLWLSKALELRTPPSGEPDNLCERQSNDEEELIPV